MGILSFILLLLLFYLTTFLQQTLLLVKLLKKIVILGNFNALNNNPLSKRFELYICCMGCLQVSNLVFVVFPSPTNTKISQPNPPLK